MSDVSPAESLRRSAAEPQCFAGFYEHHSQPLLVFLVRRTYDADVAMDLMAESFARAYLKRRSFKGETDEQAAAWLYRIADRELLKFFRKRKTERRALRRLGVEVPALSTEEYDRVVELADLDDLRSAISAGLAELSAKHRDALKLRVVDELPYEEVASRLGISQEAARTRVARGLKALLDGLDHRHLRPKETT